MKKQLLALIILLLPPLYAQANVFAREDGIIVIGTAASIAGAVIVVQGLDEECPKAIAGMVLGLLGVVTVIRAFEIINNYDSMMNVDNLT